MEFPDAGQQCRHSQCRRLDFLPVPCNTCDQVFCSDHVQPAQHACANQTSKQELVERPPLALHTCFQTDCNVVGSLRLACDRCERHFCLAHRHHGCHDIDREAERHKWEEPQRQFELAKQEVDRQVEEGLRRSRRSVSGSTTAGKVRLMRLKGRASGPTNVPATERAHFLVHPPLNIHTPPAARAAFINRAWTLGRAVDSFAATLGVPNHNNEAQAPKLKLYCRANGNQVGNMEETVEELLVQGSVSEGDSLILEYESKTGKVDNVQAYKE